MGFYLVIGGNDWFMIWLGLEINIIMFIIIIFERYRIFNVESCLKYFFIQSLGSAVFIILFYIYKVHLDFILCLILGYKIGAGPFYYWFPSICKGISWMSCFILISIQKLIPLILIRIFISWMFFFIIVVRLIIGVFGSFNQKDLKLLIAYSSVYHLGWILLCIVIGRNYWFCYMIIYIFIIFPMIYFLKNVDVIYFMDIIRINNKYIFIIVMLSVAGIPPFLGFFLKWFAFRIIIDYRIFYMIILIVCSVTIFYVYFRIIYDVIIGYYYFGGWGRWIIEEKSEFWLDIICMVGILFGVSVGIYLII